MSYFVTGAAGFIASHLTDRLLADGHRVVGYDNLSTGRLRFLESAAANPNFRFVNGDLLDKEALTRAMKGADFVFHLAANADVRFGREHPERDLEQNTDRDVQRARSDARKRLQANWLLIDRIDLRRAGDLPDARGRAVPDADVALWRVETSGRRHDSGVLRRIWISGLHLSLRIDTRRALHPRPRLRFLQEAQRGSRPDFTFWATASSASHISTCTTALTRSCSRSAS